MKIIKIELPRTLEPEFYCPFTGYNLLDEGLQDAIDAGYLYLAVNWNDPDEYVMGEDKHVKGYMNFNSDEGEDPSERVARYLESEKLTSSFLHEQIDI